MRNMITVAQTKNRICPTTVRTYRLSSRLNINVLTSNASLHQAKDSQVHTVQPCLGLSDIDHLLQTKVELMPYEEEHAVIEIDHLLSPSIAYTLTKCQRFTTTLKKELTCRLYQDLTKEPVHIL